MDMSRYLDVFVEEAKEHLQGMNELLLKLEKDPEDLKVINEIFRIAHTLKGMSGTMGFNGMANLTHAMEDVLDRMRNEGLNIGSAVIDLLFKSFDAFEEYIVNIANTGNEGDNRQDNLIKALRQASRNIVPDLPQPSGEAFDEGAAANIEDMVDEYDVSVLNKVDDMGLNAYAVRVELNSKCLLKSARAFLVFKTLEEFGEVIKSFPPADDIEDEKFDLSFSVILISSRDAGFIKEKILRVSEIYSVSVKKLEKPYKAAVSGVISKSRAGRDRVPSEGTADERDKKEESPRKLLSTGKTVRVDISRLDVLLNLVSELIIQKTRLRGIGAVDKSQEFNDAIEYLERITTNLHDAVMKVRMVPIESVFNRFPRMIRDLAKEMNKKINFTISGEDTELDRTVIDEIGDPIIHLLRNSADHGLETVAERKKLGKPEEGNIRLKAYQSGNDVIIEVSDDGRGIDLRKVKETAIERGMIDRESAGNLTDEEIIELLFQPNFSTSVKVTDLSGRGVGLDVVKTKIEALGGRVKVETEAGSGSRFIISLPLTLAIIQALLVVVGNEKYAIPLVNVNRIIRIKKDEVKKVHSKEVVMVQDAAVPLVRLNEILGIEEAPRKGNNMIVVIVQKGEKLTGFLVDGLIGQQEIVIKSLGKYLAGINYFAGATILGDGNVALILDVNSIS
jgi:two-component system chemotaxis sensor kinase CheA